jgi:copper chaperone
MKQSFTVTGMTCGHCEKSVKQAVLMLDPTAVVEIDRSHNHVQVDSELPREKIAASIEEEGYSVAA